MNLPPPEDLALLPPPSTAPQPRPPHPDTGAGMVHIYAMISDIISRSELVCHSYMLRKNRNRSTDDGRMKTGKKVDGLFHLNDDRSVEFGAIESARMLHAGDVSSKWISDSDKLGKMMRDIIGRLAIHVRHRSSLLSQLQVIGIMTAGFDIQLFRMSQPAGYVCLLHASDPLSVPRRVAEFSQLVLVLGLILKAKVWPSPSRTSVASG